MAQLSFTLNGTSYVLTSDRVIKIMARKEPEPVRSHCVRIERRIFPAKQVIEAVTGIDRADYQSMQARSIMRRLGFEVQSLPD